MLQVPYDLALGRPTGWLPPTGRALGAPARSYSLGGGLVHLTWPHRPGVQALEQQGVVAGWIELWDTDTPDTPGAAGAAVPWAALIDGSPVVDAADGEVLLAPAPDAALALLRHALDQQQSARIARLPRDSRPLPSTAPYDQLLHRPAARNQSP
ncbi:hypothetical protein [Kitasatospora cineracea]|uniref:hypothetical protein n=1 Tax=Kitasatospora cineracea TaxID=88074 RepID=UPI0036990CDE